jgi:hypothetical protein
MDFRASSSPFRFDGLFKRALEIRRFGRRRSDRFAINIARPPSQPSAGKCPLLLSFPARRAGFSLRVGSRGGGGNESRRAQPWQGRDGAWRRRALAGGARSHRRLVGLKPGSASPLSTGNRRRPIGVVSCQHCPTVPARFDMERPVKLAVFLAISFDRRPPHPKPGGRRLI